MRTLRIEKGGKIIIDGEIADMSQVDDKEEFLASILNLDVELSSDTNIGDIIHFFYDAKGFIKNVFSEEYEVVRALTTSNNLQKNYKSLRIYKSFKVEREILEDNQEFIYMIPDIDLIPSEPGEDGVNTMSSIPVIIDENIKFVHGDVVIESKTKLSLLDVMTCFFEELPALLKEGLVLS